MRGVPAVEVEVEVDEAPACTKRNWALSPYFAIGLARYRNWASCSRFRRVYLGGAYN